MIGSAGCAKNSKEQLHSFYVAASGPQMRPGATDSSMADNVGFNPPVASTDDNSGPLTLWEISIDESTPTIF